MTAIGANQNNSIVVDSTGAIWDWGHNNDGQLGIGNQTDEATPQKISSISGAVAVAFGLDHALALFPDGTMAGWGDSFNGEVGTGFESLYVTPVQVSGSGFDQPAPCPRGPAVGVPASPGPGPLELLGSAPIDELPTTCVSGPYPINVVTGNYSTDSLDLTIPGRGIPLLFTRTYNSLVATQSGPFGIGWTDSYNVYVTFDGSGNPTIHEENGAQIMFSFNGTSYQAPTRILASFVNNGNGTYTLNRRDQTHLTFNSSGQLVSETNRNTVYVTSLTYSGQNLTKVTDPAGRTITINYGANGLIGAISDSAGRSVTYGYDASNRLATVRDVANGLTQYGYDSNNRLHTITDPNGGVLTIDYDATTGNAIRLTDPMTYITNVSYGSNSASITWPNTAVTTEQFQNNEIVFVTAAAGTSIASNWSCSYDPATMGMTTLADPLNRQIVNTWDANGNLLTHTDQMQHKSLYTFDALNDIKTITDPLNVVTTNMYDGSGNLLSSSTPLVGTTQTAVVSYTYDPSHPGDVTQVTDPTGKVWKYTYDQYGDRATSTDPAGDKRTFVYDVLGRVTSSVSPRGNVTGGNPLAFTTTYAYNAFGDVTSITDPLNHSSSATYDGNRNVKTATDPDGHQGVYTYDLDNRLTQLQLPNQALEKTSYDSMNNVSSETDAMNHVTMYSYDLLNRETSVTDPLGRVTAMGYGGDGLLMANRDFLGRTTSSYYDLANNVLGAAYSDGVTARTSYTFDADGQRLTMKDGSGTSSYQWDSLHRRTQYVDGAGDTTHYTYDLSGHLLTITYPGGSNIVTRTYDAAGRLASVKDWLGNTTTFAYDADSNVSTQTYPNTTKATFTYNNADHLTQIIDVTGSKQTQFLNLSYQRDAAELLAADGSTSYGYDPLDRLGTASSTTYGYNGANNLTSITITGSTTTTLTVDAASQLSSLVKKNGSTVVQQLTYTYDNAGNRTKVVDQNNVTTTFGYDESNRLTSYGSMATYKYNGDGLRVSKTVSGSTTTQVWALPEGPPTVLKDGSANFVTGLGGLPLEQIVTSGRTTSVYYYHLDQLGSTRVITDSKGATVNTYTYDPYGNITASSGTLSNPFRYAGQYFDTESGLYYLRARYYDPTTAQFISRDPLLSLTKAPYAYVSDTPLNGTDPKGTDWWNRPAAAVIGAVGSFVGNAIDNLHSNNPLLVALGVAESVAIAAPVAAVIFFAGGGAAVAAGIDAIGGAVAGASEAAAVYGPLGAVYTARVLAQMSQSEDDYHAFPTLLDGLVNEGDATAGVGADGQPYTYINLPGAINGVSGTFQWIINGAGQITHRFFGPN